MVGIQCPIQSNLLFLRWQSNSINSRTIQISNKAWYHIPFFSKPTKHFLSHSIWCIFSLVHYCLVCKKWLVFWCRYTRDYDPDRHLKSQPGFFIIILVFSPKPNPNPQDFFSKTTSFISTFKSSLVVSNNTFLLLLLHKDTTSTAIPTTTTLPKCRH